MHRRLDRPLVKRSIVAVFAGYLVFGISSAILFGVSGQDPHVLPGGVFLERFPLGDQISDLPHQRLVAIGHRPGGIEVLVETRRRHRGQWRR